MNKGTSQIDFNDQRTPQLESLLQISLGLTKNGRDAVKLMRESLAEATLFWKRSLPEDSWASRVHEILTRRFFSSFQDLAHPQAVYRHTTTASALTRYQMLLAGTSDQHRRGPLSASTPQEHFNYVNAITNLPVEYRSAMILSYIEGFSNTEIADLAGRQPHEIESLLYHGCRLVRSELFTHLMDSSGFRKVIENREAVA